MADHKIINYTDVSIRLGYAPKSVRRGRKIGNKEDREAIEILENFCDNWAEKYTKTK